YSTPIGGIESVPIADGSQVTLNTDTRIRVDVDEHQRRVVLDRGEAFFQVAKDPTRPFIVVVGTQRVIAVGTQFSVRREAGEVQVAVTEGKVRVEDLSSSSLVGTPENVFLTPGSVARANDTGVMVQRRSVADVEAQLSWRSGVLRFRQITLAAAVAEFNRYNVRKIVID